MRLAWQPAQSVAPTTETSKGEALGHQEGPVCCLHADAVLLVLIFRHVDLLSWGPRPNPGRVKEAASGHGSANHGFSLASIHIPPRIVVPNRFTASSEVIYMAE